VSRAGAPPIAAAALAALALACGGDRPGHGTGGAPPVRSRTTVQRSWEEVFQVGGGVQDTLLQSPTGLAADGNGVYVADPSAGRVLRFDRAGQLVFAEGRPGGGPGEFRSLRDVEVDDRGLAWVLDRGNARITILGPDGRVEGRLPLEGPARSADQLVPLPGGRGAVVVAYDRENPFARLTMDGRIADRFGPPWKDFSSLEPLASQLVTAAGGGRWVAAFGMGDGFFVRDGGTWRGGRHSYVESLPFPEVETRGRLSEDGTGRVEERIAEERPVFGALSASVTGDRLAVLFGGRSPGRGRWLDVYSLPDGRYRGSYLLPTYFEQVAIGGGLLYGLADDPAPRLAAYRLPADSLP